MYFLQHCVDVLNVIAPEARAGQCCAHGLGPGRRSGSSSEVPVTVLTQSVLLAALELDEKGVMETAPASFRALLGVLGIEAALESLVRAVCTEAEPVPPHSDA